MTARPLLAATLALAAALALPASARADACDDLARQLAGHIDGLKTGKTMGGMIYLSHPLATRVMLGCPSRTVKNAFFAASNNRKPPPEFYDLVASAAAIVFTVPKDGMLRGVNRCARRVGFLRGNDVKSRYRSLDMRCTRSKSGATISIVRAKEE